MKLSETILFSLSVAFFIIGVHQTFTVGLLESYWIFMFTGALLLWYRFKKNSNSKQQDESPQTKNKLPVNGQKKQIKKATTRK